MDWLLLYDPNSLIRTDTVCLVIRHVYQMYHPYLK